ncbi:MAG: glycosyltransferase [Solirubrobacterales bacterium]|nr:glycosyltransferase [Solirubrobacterales bacterium]
MSRRLHVVVLPEWYPSPDHPVAGVFVRDQARAVAAAHDVTVLVHDAGPPSRLVASRQARVEEGLSTIRVRTGSGPGTTGGRLAFLAAASRVLARLRRDGRPADLLHAHVFSAGVLAVLLARGRLPVVLSEHHTDFMESKVRGYDARLARLVLRRAAAVCPVSALLERHLRTLEPRGRYEVVPNVVDVDAFAAPPAPRPAGQVRLAVVALLSPQKGIEHLLRALPAVRAAHGDVVLDIVGDGPSRGELEALAAHELPPGVVTFHGLQDRERIAAILGHSDVFVLPSVVESFGVVLVEALAAGLPVVTTTEVGLADVIEGRFGAVVPARDPEALAHGIGAVIDALEGFPADEARRHAANYGAATVARRWDDIYARVAGPV